MGLINLIEDPSNLVKPADTHMGKTILHVSVASAEASAASGSGFVTDSAALAQTGVTSVWHNSMGSQHPATCCV